MMSGKDDIMDTMKILFVSEQYYPPIGGVATFVRRLSQDVAASGHEVILVTAAPTAGAKLQKIEDGNITVYQMPTIPLLHIKGHVWSKLNNRLCAELAEQIKPDVVHVHLPFGLMTFGMVRELRKCGYPMVVTNHVMAENVVMNVGILRPVAGIFSRCFWKLNMGIINRADYVTSPTATALSYVQNHDLKVEADFVTNGVNSDYFAPGKPGKLLDEFGIPKGKKYLTHVGRLDGEKRVDILIDAMPMILKEHPDAMLLLGGDGTCRKDFEQQARELGIADSVKFLGFISEEQKRALLQFCDLFVIASPAELQCIAALEAMACGLPVVAADQAALRDLIGTNEYGRLFHFPSPGSLAKEVVELLDDKKLLQALRKKVRENIVQNHSARVSTERYLGIYTKVAGKSR